MSRAPVSSDATSQAAHLNAKSSAKSSAKLHAKPARHARHARYAWLLLSPFVLSLVVFFVFALARTVGYSFTQYDLFSAPVWQGLANYRALFVDPLFIRACINTFSFSVIVTGLQTVLAMLLAVVVNAPIRGQSVFRTIYYLPSVMSSAAITLIFIWFYQKHGFLNAMLSSVFTYLPALMLFALAALTCQISLCVLAYLQQRKADMNVTIAVRWFDASFAWVSVIVAGVCVSVALNTEALTLTTTRVELAWIGTRDHIGPLPLTLWAVVLQNIFTTVPTLMLLFLAGLQGIPTDLYEAAQIDGANRWQQFLHITVPQLAPVTFVVITMGMIGTLQLFDQVALLGAGVPLESRITLAYYVYHYAFPDGSSPQIGIASAAALFLGAITLVLVYAQKRFSAR